MEKTFLRSAAIFLLIMLAFAPATAQDKPPQTNNTGTISGRVVNESGQPLYDAIVTIRAYGSNDNRRTTATDRDGTFKFTELPAVVYLLSAGLPAYTLAPRDPDSTQSTSYRVGDNVTLVLIKGGVITGKVSDSSGEPLVGVRVRAQTIRDSFGQRPRYSAPARETTTDDRGVYRIYGLPTGTYSVMAGGGVNGSVSYRNDAPTYAPSGTRDTASEVSVQTGQETSDVDIRYRGEQGHAVTGRVTGPQGSDITDFGVTLSSTMDAGSQWGETTFQSPQSEGFLFSGVPDGDYDVTALSFTNPDRSLSAPKRIAVRGADVTGIELTPKPLASINGRVVLEDSNAPDCKGQRRVIVTETLVSAWHNEKEAKDLPQFIWSMGGPVYPNEQGELTLRNLAAGQYQIISRLVAKYWYLRSITLPAPIRSGVATPPSRKPSDAVANWITLRSGERLSGLTVTLAEGAGSLQGQVKLNERERLPARLYVYLVPAERENEQDVLRFLAAPITTDRKFAVNHIPPGRYWMVTQPALEGAMPTLTRLRLPDERATRTKLRRDAEQTKMEIEIKPCQNVTDYELSLRPPGV